MTDVTYDESVLISWHEQGSHCQYELSSQHHVVIISPCKIPFDVLIISVDRLQSEASKDDTSNCYQQQNHFLLVVISPSSHRWTDRMTMATLHLNPMYYLKHAWDATHSVWGKTAIVLFYLFIWIQIILAVTQLIFPAVFYACYFSTLSDYAASLLRIAIRCSDVLAIGFFLYADRGGIKVWNVAMVFVVYAGCTWAWISGSYTALSSHGAPKTCNTDEVALWSTFGWSLLALLCAIMESRSAYVTQGTQAERAPLV